MASSQHPGNGTTAIILQEEAAPKGVLSDMNSEEVAASVAMTADMDVVASAPFSEPSGEPSAQQTAVNEHHCSTYLCTNDVKVPDVAAVQQFYQQIEQMALRNHATRNTCTHISSLEKVWQYI